MSNTLLISKPSQESRSIMQAMTAAGCHCERVDGDAAALRRLRHHAFDLVITDPETTIDEDLALLDEMLEIRPSVKAILLAPAATPAEVIAALRARVFVCLTAPYDAAEIAQFAARCTTDTDWRIDIEVLSARPEWISLRANCRTLTADRVVAFLGELHAQVPAAMREDLMMGFRQVLLTAMQTSEVVNNFKVVEVSAVRTDRTLVFYVRDAVSAVHLRGGIAYAAVAGSGVAMHPPNLATKVAQYAVLLANGVVDECINSEMGNEVLLIKHTA